MKRKYQKPKPPTRQDWKNEAENEIILLQEDIDFLSDEFGLSEAAILGIEKLIDKFKGRLNEAIDLFAVTPEIAVETDDFTYDFLRAIDFNEIKATEEDTERMVSIIESNKGGQFVPCESLAEQIKLDEFLESTTANPYQLQLIA